MNLKLHPIHAVDLAHLVSSSAGPVVVKIADEKAPNNIGNFCDVLDFANYIDNHMLVVVTTVKKVTDGEDVNYAFDFDASMFETYNKPFERAQFYSNKNNQVLLTARQKAEENGKPFSMKEEELYFPENEIFYLVENASEFFDYATQLEIEETLLQVKQLVADAKDNSEIRDLVNLGYFARKTHLGTITEIEKRVYRTLLSK